MSAVQTFAVPHNPDAEESLLGSVLLSRAALVEATAAGVEPEDFHDPNHRTYFAAMLSAHEAGLGLDPVSVGSQLGPSEREHVRALQRIQAATPASANARAYALAVKDASVRRQAIADVTQAREALCTGSDVSRVLADLTATSRRSAIGSTLSLPDLATVESDGVLPCRLVRTDGRALLYPGLNDIHGLPSEGKTWLALAMIAEALLAGENAVFIDYEDGPWTAKERLLALGVPEAVVVDPARFLYVQPEGPIGPAELIQLERIRDEHNPTVIAIDAMASALATNGYDENSNTDVALWRNRIAKPLAVNGAVMLGLDHVARDPARGRGGRGAGDKLAGISGASYEAQSVRAFSREQAGIVKLVIAKDRPGRVGPNRSVAALIDIVPSEGGRRVEITFRPPDGREMTASGESGTWRPTWYMEQASRRLESETVAGTFPSKNSLTKLVGGKRERVLQAVDALVADGYVEREGTSLRSVKPYRQDEQ